ncbi:MAG: Rossmann-like and DUF2520 domain-containing protein [bacterium]
MNPRTIGIAGAGRVGQALARLLRDAGQPVAAIASRTPGRALEGAAFAGAGVVAVTYAELPGCASHLIIAVPDSAIEPVAEQLAAGAGSGVALHTCGARGPEALAALARKGVSCGTLHPLQTVSTPSQGVAAMRGIAFAVSGDGPALAWAREITALLGGETLEIREDARPLYHAAAVMASNYVVALAGAAQSLMAEAGVAPDRALRALAPLMRTALENAAAQGPEGALTGPIERGDAATVAAHLSALASTPEVRALYREAGLYTLGIARRKGLAAGPAQAVERALLANCDVEE